MDWTQDHKLSSRGRFSIILRILIGIFQKQIFHSMIMSNLALLDMLKIALNITNYINLQDSIGFVLSSEFL